MKRHEGASYTHPAAAGILLLSLSAPSFLALRTLAVQRSIASHPLPRAAPFFSFLSFALFSVHNTIRTVSLCYVWGSLKCAMIHISSPAAHSLSLSFSLSADNSSHSICTICSNRPVGDADSRITAA